MQSVEITFMSCENLRVGKKPVKKNVFVSVRTDNSSSSSSSTDSYCCTTKMSITDHDGQNPAWNETLTVDLAPSTQQNGFILLEVQHKASSSSSSSRSGSKLVGGVRVPVSDLLGGFVPRNHIRFLSYRLWNSTGERNGVINMSVRVKYPSLQPEPYRSCSQAVQPKAIGIPVGRDEKRFGGVVTGIPAVWVGRHCSTY